jgi:hypothetical protein
LESKTTQEVRLYGDPSQIQLVATIAKGSHVLVLINKDENYLLKTEFGLLGWIRIRNGTYETPIEGIYFAGD